MHEDLLLRQVQCREPSWVLFNGLQPAIFNLLGLFVLKRKPAAIVIEEQALCSDFNRPVAPPLQVEPRKCELFIMTVKADAEKLDRVLARRQRHLAGFAQTSIHGDLPLFGCKIKLLLRADAERRAQHHRSAGIMIGFDQFAMRQLRDGHAPMRRTLLDVSNGRLAFRTAWLFRQQPGIAHDQFPRTFELNGRLPVEHGCKARVVFLERLHLDGDFRRPLLPRLRRRGLPAGVGADHTTINQQRGA